MRDPYVFMIGYEPNGESDVFLDAETYASDNSGGGMYDIFAVRDILNGSEPFEIVLPWMNRRRLHRLADGTWIIEGIEEAVP
jgi:hypothetical protein